MGGSNRYLVFNIWRAALSHTHHPSDMSSLKDPWLLPAPPLCQLTYICHIGFLNPFPGNGISIKTETES